MESPRLSATKQLEPFKQPPEAERVVGVLSLGCMFCLEVFFIRYKLRKDLFIVQGLAADSLVQLDQ